MADVQPEYGYTKVADALLEQTARIKLSPTQYRIILLVWRYTYGFGRKEHNMSLTFLEEGTGCDKRSIQRELSRLEERKIIFQRIKNGAYRYIKFNKNYDEWDCLTIGETTNGKTTNGETANGDSTNGSVGETTNGTIGETANQDKQSLYTNIETVSQSEEELSDEEIVSRAVKIEKHFCERRKVLSASSVDFHEMKILMASKIPVDFAIKVIDQSFDNYKPKHDKDEIRRFVYCSTAIYDEWAKELVKHEPVQPRKFERSRGHSKSKKTEIPIISYDDETVSEEEYQAILIKHASGGEP